MIPAWEPVNDRALMPASWSAIASSAIEIRSPAVRSMSISRPGGTGLILAAMSTSSSVNAPIAETTTTVLCPSRAVRATRSATRRMRVTSPTDVPPYFWTTMPMSRSSVPAVVAAAAQRMRPGAHNLCPGALSHSSSGGRMP